MYGNIGVLSFLDAIILVHNGLLLWLFLWPVLELYELGVIPLKEWI